MENQETFRKSPGQEWTRREQHFRNREFALPAARPLRAKRKVRLYGPIFGRRREPPIRELKTRSVKFVEIPGISVDFTSPPVGVRDKLPGGVGAAAEPSRSLQGNSKNTPSGAKNGSQTRYFFRAAGTFLAKTHIFSIWSYVFRESDPESTIFCRCGPTAVGERAKSETV